MKSIFLIAIVLFSIILSSCNTSNKVVSSSFIQKRKYNKGYHLEWLANKGNPHPSIAKNEKISAKEKVLIPYQTIIPKKDSIFISNTFIPNKEDDKLIASIDNGMIITYQPKAFFIQDNDSLKNKNTQDAIQIEKSKYVPLVTFIATLIGLVCCIVLALYPALYWFGLIFDITSTISLTWDINYTF